jgi:hypothetical protein
MQVFLSPTKAPGPGIFEVSSNDAGNLSCNCKDYKARETCKHVRFVSAKMDSNKGVYPLEISSRATTEEAEEAKKSSEAFRQFVIKFGRIEVY